MVNAEEDETEENVVLGNSINFNNENNYNHLTTDNVFEAVNDNNQANTFIPMRENLQTFLSKSFKGVLILTAFQKNGKLTEYEHKMLAELVVDREMYILAKKNDFSHTNIFSKIE